MEKLDGWLKSELLNTMKNKNEKVPLSGYEQTVACNSIYDKGDENEDKIDIEYDLELNVINMGITQWQRIR